MQTMILQAPSILLALVNAAADVVLASLKQSRGVLEVTLAETPTRQQVGLTWFDRIFAPVERTVLQFRPLLDGAHLKQSWRGDIVPPEYFLAIAALQAKAAADPGSMDY